MAQAKPKLKRVITSITREGPIFTAILRQGKLKEQIKIDSKYRGEWYIRQELSKHNARLTFGTTRQLRHIYASWNKAQRKEDAHK